MLKKGIFFVVVLGMCCLAFAQENTSVLRQWNAANKFEGAKLHCSQGYKALIQEKSDSLLIKVTQSKSENFSDIQLMFVFEGQIKKGTSYKIEMSLVSSTPGSVQTSVIMHNKPWHGAAKGVIKRIRLRANENKNISIEFTAEKDLEKVRVPCLYLGKIKAGTELNIKSVVFKEASYAEPPTI